jgi:hypothetical protein
MTHDSNPILSAPFCETACRAAGSDRQTHGLIPWKPRSRRRTGQSNETMKATPTRSVHDTATTIRPTATSTNDNRETAQGASGGGESDAAAGSDGMDNQGRTMTKSRLSTWNAALSSMSVSQHRIRLQPSREPATSIRPRRARGRQLSWSDVQVIDDDLGRSRGGIARPGFEKLLAAICEGRASSRTDRRNAA